MTVNEPGPTDQRRTSLDDRNANWWALVPIVVLLLGILFVIYMLIPPQPENTRVTEGTPSAERVPIPAPQAPPGNVPPPAPPQPVPSPPTPQ